MTAIALAARDRVYLAAPGVLVAEREKLPLPLNAAKQSKGIWLIRKEISSWREWAEEAGQGAEPLTPPVVVTVEHLRKNRASIPDAGAPILAAKAVIDGLITVGVLPDDGPNYVTELRFMAPVIEGWHGLRVTLTEVPA